MRLKRLELNGFKSFAERTEIVFNEGITGIVGPNGSGKSNIGDAVRWVLGEQSARTLRGASMQDVIFNGTQHRKPLSYCEVSLVFDNEDKALPLDYAEIMVTRRVYRSGDSEYYLNRSACRLKDIVDLFRDTGIGKEGYSIIGQGRIDDILSRKGEDRRTVFEEAAGIAKFKARKEEADKKLEHTLDNISRVDDILAELRRRLEPLEEQARTARIYLEKSAELKVLDLNLYLVRSEKMEAKLKELDSELQGLRAVLDHTEVELQTRTGERDRLQTEISALEEKITAAHEQVLAGINAVHEAKDACAAVQHRIETRGENRARLLAEKDEAGKRLEELRELFSKSADDTAGLETRTAGAENALEAARKAEADAAADEQMKESALEEHNEKVLDAVNRLSVLMNNQTRLKTMRQTMEQRLTEIREQDRSMADEQTALENAWKEAEERLAREEAEQRALSDALADVRAELERADAGVISARHEYDEKLAFMRGIDSRQKLLSEMSGEMEGYSHSVRKAMLYAKEKRIPGVYGTLTQLLDVPREYETAIDMVLGASQQDIVTEDEETAKEMIRYLRENRLGRATFLPLTTVRSRLLTAQEKAAADMNGYLGIASDLIGYDERFRGIVENLLGRTVIADDLDHGIRIMRRGEQAFRLVTLQGDVMHSGGSMTGGSTASRSVNLFSRERELKELTQQLCDGQNELERLLRIMQDGQKRKDDLKAQSASALEALHQQEIAVARENERLENAKAEIADHLARMREIKDAIAQLEESLTGIDEQLAMVSGDNDLQQNDREEMEKKTAELQRELAAARERTAEANALTMRLTLEANDLRHDLESLTRDRSRFEAETARLDKEQEKRTAELERMDAQDSQDRAEAARLTADAGMRELEQARREQVTRSLETSRQNLQDKLRELLADMEGLHQTHNRDADRLHRAELSRSKTDGDLKTLNDRIWNTYEVTRAGAEEFRITENFSQTDADRRAAQLATEIRALGIVNVKAVEEYADTRERYDEMNTQREDLAKAEKDLRDLIDRLLEQMRVTFTDNFAKLQAYFSETFTRLFGGGHAELLLTDPSDPLNCAIEINAQPPGKKLQLLTLLSGGERTLTAIAILFATLKLKPTPFCILDEIEAALDDANISYFADYLAEYRDGTQFVVVTHRKGTMERCDALYGVAMEEQGVSKMVSVSLKDYK
ncbi:MAG: chromosome segregation protein SMC [Clostridia bacterium]|nr:chromosome segregation protein SMC [Clostridia bacterium]